MKSNITIFFSVLIFGAFLAWLSGYDFDHRSEDVAVYTFLVIVFAFLASAMPKPKE